MTRTSLTGQHALVTGASRGIGAAIAMALANAHANLTLIGRSAADLGALVEKLPGSGRKYIHAADVTDATQIHQAIRACTQELGPLDIVVNNAGQAISAAIENTDAVTWQQMIDVNLTGIYHVIHAAIDSLTQSANSAKPSRIINIASTAGLTGYPQVSAYVAAKHGVVGLTRSLALELARKNLTVNAICPGYTNTDIATNAMEALSQKTDGDREQALKMLTARNPQRRLIEPEEVASAVLWLCDPLSRSVNGQCIVIDGGETIG